MIRHHKVSQALVAAGVAALVLAGCSGNAGVSEEAGSAESETTTEETEEAVSADVPSWCGPEEITFGLLDGFGGNSWRLVTTASGEEEALKCPSVTDYVYADGQGDQQKATSDIQAMVATGVDAIVVFPDTGEAMLPALRSAYEAGVVTVPYRVNPGGVDGVDYDVWIGADFIQSGKDWAEWTLANFPDGAKILFLSGPAGNSQGEDEGTGAKELLSDAKYEFIGEQPFEVTNWDPAKTQEVLTAAIAKYPEIDIIFSDFGPSLVGALPEFTKSGRAIPALATSDGNVLGCFWQESQDAGNGFDMMSVATGNDNVRLAVQTAIALATGGVVPDKGDGFIHPKFEDSVSGSPSPVQCRSDLPGDIYLSALLDGDSQAALLK
ncbi:substrate-binding domain-containing protein [Pontimonas sp.]|jgi:ribose transport system substrate-binding protein|nr:substrate-binding domain-containing protein [Pontimonas sp.]